MQPCNQSTLSLCREIKRHSGSKIHQKAKLITFFFFFFFFLHNTTSVDVPLSSFSETNLLKNKSKGMNSVNGHEHTYFNNTPDCRTEVVSSEEYLRCKWLNCCVTGFGTHPHPPPPLRPPFPQEDLLNYCRQMDDIQQISMAFCESRAIFFFICSSQ